MPGIEEMEQEIAEIEKSPEMQEQPKQEPAKEEPVKEPEAKVEPEKKEEQKTPEVVAKELYDNLHKAVTQQRYENRDLKKTIDAFKQEFLTLKDKLPKPETAPEPSKEEDPLGYVSHKLQQIDQRLDKGEQEKQQAAQQQEVVRFTQQVEKLESDFRKTKPDYDEAFQFLKDFRRKDLELYGVVDDESVYKDLAQQSYNISLAALKSGKNPADIIYQMASRYGYKPKEVKAEVKTEVKNDAQKQLEEVMSGQEATKTLAKGGETETGVTVEQLQSAEGEEFDKLWAQYFKQKK